CAGLSGCRGPLFAGRASGQGRALGEMRMCALITRQGAALQGDEGASYRTDAIVQRLFARLNRKLKSVEVRTVSPSFDTMMSSRRPLASASSPLTLTLSTCNLTR